MPRAQHNQHCNVHYGAFECQLKRWKSKRRKRVNSESDSIHAASSAEDLKRSIANSRFVEFASGRWQMME